MSFGAADYAGAALFRENSNAVILSGAVAHASSAFGKCAVPRLGQAAGRILTIPIIGGLYHTISMFEFDFLQGTRYDANYHRRWLAKQGASAAMI